jgi:hypothetical protein
MALPALFIPTSLDASGLSPEAAERLRASWAGWWEPFREELRASPPAENSAEERQAVARLAQHIFGMMATLRWCSTSEPRERLCLRYQRLQPLLR